MTKSFAACPAHVLAEAGTQPSAAAHALRGGSGAELWALAIGLPAAGFLIGFAVGLIQAR